MRLFPALLLLSLANVLSFAQTFEPKTITFTGTPGFSQAELLAASGLTPGNAIAAADLQTATQRLADTGAFADVRFRYDGQSVTFALTPGAAMLPVRYVNFPWWTDEALTKEMVARVPLFHGSVPLSGGMEGNVAKALEQLLAERHIPAAIEANPESDPKNNEVAAIAFRVAQPNIVVGTLSFTGDISGWAPGLAEVSKEQSGKEYTEGLSADAVRDAVLHVYRGKGFAQAEVAAPTVGAPVTQGATIAVPFTAAITAGEQYRLGRFSLTGSPLVNEAEFLKAAPLKPGDVAEEVKLRQSLFLVTGPYAAQGYIDAKVDATPAFHPEQRTVDYSISVIPGEPYRMGQLTVLNLDEARKAKVLEVWALHPGAPFDKSYAPVFLKKNAAQLHTLDGYSATYRQIKHLDTHIVDLQVTFKRDKALGAD